MQQEKEYTEKDMDLIAASSYLDGHNAGYEEAKAEQHPGTSVWVKADAKPEHNVGVLVFIPGEDNHITSGMWDISNEWVLLDEYRTPEEEVTHWMPLPAFPEGYSHDMLLDEWVSTLKMIAKEELAKRPSKEGNKDRELVVEKRLSEVQKTMGTLSFAEEAAAWAAKNGYKWENFAYWKDGKEYPLQEIYNNAYNEKRAGEMLPKVTDTLKKAEDFLKELKQKVNQQNRNNVND